MRRESNNRHFAIAALACAGALLVALHVTNLSPDGLWAETLVNSTHVAVFSIVATLVFSGLSFFPTLAFNRRILITATACLVLGAISEGAQMTGPRDASYSDLALDYLGAAAALLIIAGFLHVKATSRPKRRLFITGGLALFIVALLPQISVSAAYIWRNYSFPTLVSFDSPLVHSFIRTQNADLLIRHASDKPKNVAEVSFREGAWPGLIVHDIWPDWLGFEYLIVELSVPGSEPLEVNIRVHDRRHRDGEQLYNDRFNTRQLLEPDFHAIRLPLEKIRNGPANRVMDLSRIDGLVIFCTRKESGRAILIYEIRLE